MGKFLQKKMHQVSLVLELLISLSLAIAIVILIVRLFIESGSVSVGEAGSEAMTEILGDAMTLAVGVEFIKMLCTHTPNTIIETLMFAIARGMVVEYASSQETLLGVICIAILFATKKYLFVEFSEVDRITLRGSQTVQMANHLAGVHIPADGHLLLRDVVSKKLEEEEKTIAIGSCVYYTECALCISNMHDDKITRVDILKAI